MLRFCRASTSAGAAPLVLRRSYTPSSARLAGSPSDGLFPPAQEPKADLDRHDRRSKDPLADEPALPAVGAAGKLGQRRLPALKGMTAGGSLAKALAAGGGAAAGRTTREEGEPAKAAVDQQQQQQSSATDRPASALDAILSSSAKAAATTTGGAGRPSSILTDILNSPALGSSSSALSRSSPYLPSPTHGPAAAFLSGSNRSSAFQHQSIFTAPPTPPPTHTLNVHLKVSRNNTYATIAYAHDGVSPRGCEQISGGTVGFKKAAQGGFECGHQVAVAVLRAIREENGRKLREKRDYRKVFYREKAEERRLQLVEAFEGLKERQQLLAEEKRLLEIAAPDFESSSPSALSAPSSTGSIAAPNSNKPTTYAASEPLGLTPVADPAASQTAVGEPVAGPSYLQRRAALNQAQRSLSDGLAAYNSSVRLLSSELRDLAANKIPSDALLPRAAVGADVVQESISAELKEAEEQAAGQVGVYFKLFIGGFGQGREAFMTALLGREGHFVRPLCTGLGDRSQMKCVPLFPACVL